MLSDLKGQKVKAYEIPSDTCNSGLIGQYNMHIARSVMGSYQILYAIALIEVRLLTLVRFAQNVVRPRVFNFVQ